LVLFKAQEKKTYRRETLAWVLRDIKHRTSRRDEVSRKYQETTRRSKLKKQDV
jgi:hypothetical protein